MSNFIRFGIIYKAVGLSGKVYIGKTVEGFDKRRIQHHSNAYNKNHSAYDTKFYRALRKYKKSEIKWTVLYDNVPSDMLDCMEMWIISMYNSFLAGYNSTMGGGGALGLKLSDEARAKISELSSIRNRGSKNPMFGKEHTEETKKKIGDVHRGKKLSEEQKKFLSYIHTGRVVSTDIRNKMALARGGKEFYAFKNDILLGKWNNQRQCSRDLEIGRNRIQDCLYGRREEYKGYSFIYVEDYVSGK